MAQSVMTNSAHTTARKQGISPNDQIMRNYQPNSGKYERECREVSMRNPSSPYVSNLDRWLRT